MKRILFIFLLVGFVVLTSCQKPEEVTISKYFQAMNVGEKGDMDTMSAMAVNPKLIKYESYEIVSISEPEEKEIEYPSLLKKIADIDKQKKEIGLKFGDLNDEILDLEDELADARGSRKKNELKTKIAEKKKEKEDVLNQFKDVVAKRKDLAKKLETIGNVMKASVSRPNMKNLEMFTGKYIRVIADVKITLLNKEVKNYVFILKKYILSLAGKKLTRSRYLITDILTQEEYKKRISEDENNTGSTEEVSEPETKTEAQ